VALDHGHIYGQCKGLTEAGGDLRYVFDPDPAKVVKFCDVFHGVQPLPSLEAVLEKPEIKLIAAAAVPSERCALGLRVMDAGKDYFTDKTPFTTLDQLASARAKVTETGRKYAVYFSERLHVECAVRAGQLIEQGAVGRVVNVIGLGPHRSSPASRPAWFWSKEKTGGILCDIGSHQFEQFLHYAGAKDAQVVNASVANYRHKDYPEFEDWGDAESHRGQRRDELHPHRLAQSRRSAHVGRRAHVHHRHAGLHGVAEVFERRRGLEGDHLFLVDHQGEHHLKCHGEVGYPFFGQLILDCLNRTENAMTQEHAFKAAELCLIAQEKARRDRVGR
jgi:predicted dehydrogenase